MTKVSHQVSLFRPQSLDAETHSLYAIEELHGSTGPQTLTLAFCVATAVLVAGILNMGWSPITAKGVVRALPPSYVVFAPKAGVLASFGAPDLSNLSAGDVFAEIDTSANDPSSIDGETDRQISQIRRAKQETLDKIAIEKEAYNDVTSRFIAERDSLQHQIDSIQSQIAALTEIEGIKKEQMKQSVILAGRDIVSKSIENDSTAAFYSARGNRLELDVQKAALMTSLTKLTSTERELMSNHRKVVAELVAAAARLDSNVADLNAPSRLRVTAPIKGTVQRLLVTTPIAVKEGTPIAVIVPKTQRMYGEFLVDADVAMIVKRIDNAKVKVVSASKQTRLVDGTRPVVSLSPIDENGHYRVLLELDERGELLSDGAAITLDVYRVKEGSLLARLLYLIPAA